MKVVGLMVCGVGEADRYLEGTLMEFSRLCDDAVIACNGDDEKRDALIDKYNFRRYRDDREWGVNQPYIKTDLLKHVAELNPDWIVPLDADETFTEEFTRDELERLTKNSVAWYFYLINHWDSPERYSRGLSFWNIRFFKFMPEIGFDYLRKPVHCGLAPPFFYNAGNYAPFLIRHYGLMRKEDRMKKVERYEKYDPRGVHKDRSYYEALKQEGGGSEYNQRALLEKVGAEVEKMGKQKVINENKIKNIINMEVKRYVWVKRLEDDRTLDIPESQLEETIKRGGFEFLGYVGEAPREEVVVSAPKVVEKAELKCEICGFIGKTAPGLNLHRMGRHNIGRDNG